uniref:ZP domain-containing protein n=1 Tax=Glossina morsitans morsitans TaxID=37546 RepID=A0A1B0FAP6_GLOMM
MLIISNFVVNLLILSHKSILGGHYSLKPDLHFFQKPGPFPSLAPSNWDSHALQLPEIADNRQANDLKRFIPLHRHYLPLGSLQSSNQIDGYKERFNASEASEKTDSTKVIGSRDLSSSAGYDHQTPERFRSSSTINAATNASSADPPPGATVIRQINIDSPDLRELRCLSSPDKSGFFHVILRINQSILTIVPVVDNDSAEKSCQFSSQNNHFILYMKEECFEKCGVYHCAGDLCLRVRFPSIRGMRTASDSILTLHCEIQKKVAVKTHAIKMGVTREQQARSLGTYARGGKQNNLRTRLELLRKTSEGYTQHVNSERIVQLGEELLLRAHVLPGDGWNYAKLTDITFQRISPDGDLLQEAVLITSEGCLNPFMLSVCQGILFEAPLAYKVPFKAFMFQGMSSGDELIVSVRISGCLYPQDCSVNSKECARYADSTSLARHKRSLEINSSSFFNVSEASQISKIPFRVFTITDDDGLNLSYQSALEVRYAFFIGFLTFIIILMAVVIFAIKFY